MTAKQDVPLLSDLMPWSVAAPRLGRAWIMAPDAGSLRARWDALLGADGPAERERLFRPSRARTLHTAVGQLPGQATAPGRLARLVRGEAPCPEPVRVRHGTYDQQWLLPDHRLIDAARPELWRVADARQLFAVEQPRVPQDTGPALAVSAVLPVGRQGRVRPLYRRPAGAEPNLAPGLLDHLADRLGRPVTAEDAFGYLAATARHDAGGLAVPLTTDPELWTRGVALGRELIRLHTRGAHTGERPRLPGGRRPYVRAALPARGLPAELAYDPDEEALLIGEGRISPVPAAAWDAHAGGVRVLEAWYERRTGAVEPGTLEAVRPAGWPQEWTTDLLELITVLALLGEAGAEQERLTAAVGDAPPVTAGELTAAGVLPAPAAARRPASVLDHQEEGPDGQFALL
ncbi:DNA methyltransferase [Streptomyces sp. Ru73]|uniref:type ISP restriction/modification enzyme n=1 Tax=Streptomyces sp. Ru73 TaxID=2080748 RepID=UPI000CDCED0F|nr:type ISP restriction/modification enzyme [Streptomyces sp. Ru73]POX38998.1 DNA methyltransferase [Streptomyces sp. Ru73]